MTEASTLNEASVAAAMDVTDRYLKALNAMDEAACEATFHFPHIRISNNQVFIQQGPGENFLERFRGYAAKDGWHHSTWDLRRPIHATDTKVHLEIHFTRWREDNTAIGTWKTIYIITQVEGRWGLQARTTFAP